MADCISDYHHASCDQNSQVCVGICGSSYDCTKGKCLCAPNYRYDQKTGGCVRFKCESDQDCRSYDRNRVCNVITSVTAKRCDCHAGYSPLFDGKGLCLIMSATNGQSCTKLSNCGNFERCTDQHCQCNASYFFNNYRQRCEYYACPQPNRGCYESYDPFRVCNSNGCVCNRNYYPDHFNGDKCQYHPPTTTPSSGATSLGVTFIFDKLFFS